MIVLQQEKDSGDAVDTKEDHPTDEESKTDETESAIEDDQNVEEKTLPARSIKTSTTAYGKEYIAFGTEITLEAELENFTDADIFTVQWQYSKDGVEYLDAQNADTLSYTYVYSLENYNYLWRIAVTIEESPSVDNTTEDIPAEDHTVGDNTTVNNE